MPGKGRIFYGEHFEDVNEPIFTGIPTFLKLPYIPSIEELSKLKPDIAIIGEPMDMATTIRPGARYGPRAVRAASTVPSPPYSHFNIETGIDPFDEFFVVDHGDAPVIPGDVMATLKSFEKKVYEISYIGICPFIIGGDHSVTFANIKGWAEARGYKKIGLIHFDCHADTAHTGLCGFEYDHGAHIRRIWDLGILKGENYTLIGPQGFWPDKKTYEWMRDTGMLWFTSFDVWEIGIKKIAEVAVERALDGTDAVWITFDVDAMDPSVCPGTGEPEPGGLTSREAIGLIRMITKNLDIEKFGFDILEVAPMYDVSDNNSYNGGITSLFASRIILEVMGGLAIKRAGLSEGKPVRPKIEVRNQS
jgi:agmatinase